MKKLFAACTAGWSILIISAGAVYYTAKNDVPIIEAPELVSVQEIEDQGVEIEWTSVDYATSYRVFRRENEACEWELLEVVTAETFSYTDMAPPESGCQYSMRTCNGSMGHLNLSDYSNILTYFP